MISAGRFGLQPVQLSLRSAFRGGSEGHGGRVRARVSNAAALRRLACAVQPRADGAAGGGKGKKGKDKEESVYGKTVLLPATSFEMRANSVVRRRRLTPQSA